MLTEGSQIKVKVDLSLPSGLTLDDVQYTLTFKTRQGEWTLPPEYVIRKGEELYAIIDTAKVGHGNYKVIADIFLPDETSPEGRRLVSIKDTTEINIGRR